MTDEIKVLVACECSGTVRDAFCASVARFVLASSSSSSDSQARVEQMFF